jgi:hypothetical protein
MAAAALSFGTAAPAEGGAFLHATRRRPRRGREGCGRGGRSGSQLEFEVDVDIFQQGEDLETRRREWPCERGSQDQDVAKPFKNLPKMKSLSHQFIVTMCILRPQRVQNREIQFRFC